MINKIFILILMNNILVMSINNEIILIFVDLVLNLYALNAYKFIVIIIIKPN